MGPFSGEFPPFPVSSLEMERALVRGEEANECRTTLSHDFYQVMIGKDDMTLHGWRQLVEWSLEHSRMDDAERADALREWEKLWDGFVRWVLEEYREVELVIGEEKREAERRRA